MNHDEIADLFARYTDEELGEILTDDQVVEIVRHYVEHANAEQKAQLWTYLADALSETSQEDT
jgi:hypothetical protein